MKGDCPERRTKMFENIFRYWCEVLRPIEWQTWDNGTNRIVKDLYPYFYLRLFPSLSAEKRHNAIFMCPPHAGRHPNITDASILMQQKAGFDVYVLEQIAGNWLNRDLTLDQAVSYGRDCWLAIDQPKIMANYCQGVWYGNLIADRIAAVDKPTAQFCFAGPVDFHAGDGYIKNACARTPYALFEWIVAMNFGLQPGWMQWLNFAFINPKAVFWDDFVKLWDYVKAGNDEKILEWHHNHSWYYFWQNLPGPLFLHAVKYFFQLNQLNDAVDFRKFDWPLFIYTGKQDKITPSEQSKAMAKLVGTRPDQINIRNFEKAGHTAVFTSKENLEIAKYDLLYIDNRYPTVMSMAA